MIRPVALVVAILVAATAIAAAETPEQRQACTDDAFQFCSHAIPDRDRVFACLIEKHSQISSLCVAGLAPFLPPEPTPVVAKKPGKPAAKPGAKPGMKTAARPPPKGPLKLSPSGR